MMGSTGSIHAIQMHTLRTIAATRRHVSLDTQETEIVRDVMYPMIPGPCEGSLLPHQIDHSERLMSILDTRRVAGDLTKPGGGKTFVASYLAKTRKLPVIVLCPKSMINTWHKVLTSWGVPIVSITNYDMARASHSDSEVKWFDMRQGHTTTATICPWIKKKRIFNQKEQFKFIASFPYKVMVIVDEEHTGKNTHTQTFSLLKGIKVCAENEGHESIYLSATPIEKKVNLKSLLYFLGYVKKPDMNAVNSYFRKVIGTTNIADIHSYLYNRERSVSSMPEPEYPEGIHKDIQAITIVMNEEKTNRIAAINREIVMARRGLALKQCDNSIGLMNGNRQLVEKEKIDEFVRLTLEKLGEFRRVGTFLNYKYTLYAIRDALLDHMDEDDISLIHGELTNAECDEEARKYVEGETRVLLSTIKKGGQSLSFHDTIGGQDTFVIISPPTSATNVEQCCGRHFRTGLKSRVVQRIIFTAGDPIEESIRTALSLKLDDMLTLTTGCGSDYNLSVTEDVDLYDMVDISVI